MRHPLFIALAAGVASFVAMARVRRAGGSPIAPPDDRTAVAFVPGVERA